MSQIDQVIKMSNYQDIQTKRMQYVNSSW